MSDSKLTHEEILQIQKLLSYGHMGHIPAAYFKGVSIINFV